MPKSRLHKVFDRVRRYVAKKFPTLGRTRLKIDCPTIVRARKGRSSCMKRYFMHAGHKPFVVCCSKDAAKLPNQFLMGLFFHEFGHVAGEQSESGADAWVFTHFGVIIEYRGPLYLEWVRSTVLRHPL